MRRSLLLLAALAVLIPMAGSAPSAGEETTLTGSFVWNHQGRPGDLEAVFIPTGDSTWNVDFHFEFRGKPHTYSGTAEGSLGKGKLEGTVKNENRRRTFSFSGSFEDGTFKGTHAEIEDGVAHDTGTLTLAP